MWTGPAPMRPYNKLVHPRTWRAFMEYGNGIVGDMCIHMYDMVRWMMDLEGPDSVSSTGGILVDKTAKPTSPTRKPRPSIIPKVKIVWTHRPGEQRRIRHYPWAAIFYGDKGTFKASVMGYDFVPADKNAKADSS